MPGIPCLYTGQECGGIKDKSHARPAGLVIEPVCLSVSSGLLVPSSGDVQNLELVQIKADACCGFVEGETRRLIQKSLMVTETSDTF